MLVADDTGCLAGALAIGGISKSPVARQLGRAVVTSFSGKTS